MAAPQLGEEHTLSRDEVSAILRSLVVSSMVGGLVGMLSAYLFLVLARTQASCIVYTALYFSGGCAILMGIACLTGAAVYTQLAVLNGIIGCLLIFSGACMICCTTCCYGRYIPFTVAVVEMVADAISHHPAMMGVALIGTFVSLHWMAVSVVLFGIAGLNGDREPKSTDMKEEVYAYLFVTALMFSWGHGVIVNTCHVIYAGVFGRHYFGAVDQGVLCPSISVALTTSFGSVCFGSFIVAFVDALHTVVAAGKKEAKEEGNIVLCLVLCVVDCFLQCIGEMIEYFNDWAYVQCAIRGASFCEAAKITFSTATCANLSFIITDLLVNMVRNLGAFFCATLAGAAGAATGAVIGHYCTISESPIFAVVIVVGGIAGFVAGILCGTTAMSLFNSGVKTILVCWSEDANPLASTNPELHHAFCDKIKGKALGEDGI